MENFALLSDILCEKWECRKNAEVRRSQWYCLHKLVRRRKHFRKEWKVGRYAWPASSRGERPCCSRAAAAVLRHLTELAAFAVNLLIRYLLAFSHARSQLSQLSVMVIGFMMLKLSTHEHSCRTTHSFVSIAYLTRYKLLGVVGNWPKQQSIARGHLYICILWKSRVDSVRAWYEHVTCEAPIEKYTRKY